MTTPDKYVTRLVENHKSFRDSTKSQPWLAQIRGDGIDRFQKAGFPTKQLEDWRFTDISALSRIEWTRPEIHDKTLNINDFSKFTFGNMDSYLLVFINGRCTTKAFDNGSLPDNVIVDDLAYLVYRNEDWISSYLSRISGTNGNPFLAMNSAFIEDGAVIRVPDNTIIEKPIHIIYFTVGRSEPTIVYPRNLIIVGKASRATVVESYASIGEGCHFSNVVSEVLVDDGGQLNHYKVQREGPDGFHMSSGHIAQNHGSAYSSNSITIGGRISRNEINVSLNGDDCECTLNGLYLGKNQQLIDNHTTIEHTKPNCRSHELYKGILDDKSSAVFNGRIHVHPDAQKTDAKQTNRALLLSDNARINTKPELEIYADDVKCTHGATIGQLDNDALFYLRSRGIDTRTARSILTDAFANDALDNLCVDEIKAEIREIVTSHFT